MICRLCCAKYSPTLPECPQCVGLVQCPCGDWIENDAMAKLSHVAECGGEKTNASRPMTRRLKPPPAA